MLDINNPVQWQLRDDKYLTLMPWYTHGMLAELKKWDLSDKTVLEWGGGWSTIFYSFYAKKVYTIETDHKWWADICDTIRYLNPTSQPEIQCRFVTEADYSKVDFYTAIPEGCDPDIIIVDGILRFECIQKGIEVLQKRGGGILIVDNYQQDGFDCPACVELLKPFEGHIYRQEDHTDHHGNPWQTAYWNIK